MWDRYFSLEAILGYEGKSSRTLVLLKKMRVGQDAHKEVEFEVISRSKRRVKERRREFLCRMKS